MPKATIDTKFFNYRQNNSGGSFVIDEARGLSINVWIEAIDSAHANSRAESIGLYFDGEGDCPCCGNRWYSAYDPGEEKARCSRGYLGSWGNEDAPGFIHTIDGKIHKITKETQNNDIFEWE